MASEDFRVRNGLVVNTNLIYALGNSGRIGINNTAPTANLHVTGTANVSGNVVLGSVVTVIGNTNLNGVTTVSNTMNVTGTANIASLTVVGNTTFQSGITSSGALSFSNSISVTGSITTTGGLSINTSASFSSTITASANITSTTAVIAPIFYDYNDTAWYVNPAGTSRIVNFTFATGNWNNSTDGVNRFHFVNSSTTYIQGYNNSNWYIIFGDQGDNSRSIFTGNGDFYTKGNIVAYWSDRRLKKNINKISDWRTIINGLNGYTFEWNEIGKKLVEEDGVQVGLIAQEVKEVLPQAAVIQELQYQNKVDGVGVPREGINYDPENPYLTVKEEKLIPVLVEAIKGLMAEIEELKKKV